MAFRESAARHGANRVKKEDRWLRFEHVASVTGNLGTLPAARGSATVAAVRWQRLCRRGCRDVGSVPIEGMASV